ncbi:hypothetical protein [Caulobacter sp. DWP3-1-3b2]|uniref:hypothetical protein n=1 Tax=Caulobacter sp. DWP3-1-3b2 TaxID=2804643 RepID=UPI003CE7519F
MSRYSAAGWAAVGAATAALAIFGASAHRTAPSASVEEGVGGTASLATLVDGEVRLSAAQQERAGLRVAPLAAGGAPQIKQGFARGLDVSTLAAINAEIATARAAAVASKAEARRLVALAAQDQSASARAVEAARAQAAADAARTDLAERRVGLEFGAGLARLDLAARQRLLGEIAAGKAALVRIDVPGASSRDGSRVIVADGGITASVSVLGPAAAADPRLQSAGLLAIVRGPMARSATVGRVLAASLEQSSTEPGVIVPREALVRWRNAVWAYRRTAPGVFVRRELVDARPIASGWFVTTGFSPGDVVAVGGGAGTLLAIERGGEQPGEKD